jgi:hypothetical protein
MLPPVSVSRCCGAMPADVRNDRMLISDELRLIKQLAGSLLGSRITSKLLVVASVQRHVG